MESGPDGRDLMTVRGVNGKQFREKSHSKGISWERVLGPLMPSKVGCSLFCRPKRPRARTRRLGLKRRKNGRRCVGKVSPGEIHERTAGFEFVKSRSASGPLNKRGKKGNV